MYRGVETGINLPRETGNSHTKRIIYHKLAHTELIPKNRVQDANFLMVLTISDLALTSFGVDASG